MSVRYFRNLSTIPARADIETEIRRLQGLSWAGYEAFDGWRVSVEEPPDVAMARLADGAGDIERRAAALADHAGEVLARMRGDA